GALRAGSRSGRAALQRAGRPSTDALARPGDHGHTNPRRVRCDGGAPWQRAVPPVTAPVRRIRAWSREASAGARHRGEVRRRWLVVRAAERHPPAVAGRRWFGGVDPDGEPADPHAPLLRPRRRHLHRGDAGRTALPRPLTRVTVDRAQLAEAVRAAFAAVPRDRKSVV